MGGPSWPLGLRDAGRLGDGVDRGLDCLGGVLLDGRDHLGRLRLERRPLAAELVGARTLPEAAARLDETVELADRGLQIGAAGLEILRELLALREIHSDHTCRHSTLRCVSGPRPVTTAT